MLELLKTAIRGCEGYAEIRFHNRIQCVIEARNGALTRVEHRTLSGAGVRVLVDGGWGFVSTNDVTEAGLRKALLEAEEAARAGAPLRKEKVKLAPAAPAQGEFVYYDKAEEPDIAEKIRTILAAEERIRERSPLVTGSIAMYTQYEDEKFIVNSHGANAHILDNKPSIHVIATVARDDQLEMALKSAGVTGSWVDLLRRADLDVLVDSAVDLALQKLDATYAKGGQYTVILDPELVGILAHEAIGHTVEADFVLSGSIVRDKIGEQVASNLVTMVDDGHVNGAVGMVLVDDEGVPGQRTTIIEQGILRAYLHSRESAAIFDTEPCGNARAFTYQDEPLIRMTNTFVLPGEDNLDQMIQGVDDGFVLKGLGQGGQADATAEFMFGVREAYRITSGKVGEMVKGITISGQAFDVLKSVDAVSSDFAMEMGAGHCGKFQLAKVDSGGPYLRCTVSIGGHHD
ncbi:MAG: TldD/PmbA family protein [Firmicutes bacterium]|nr:TldD/PmbA family protein [Bacillota bacterium]